VRPPPTEADALRELMAGGREARGGSEPDPKPTDAGSLTTRRLSDIEAKPVNWLWPGRIARGKLTIIAGNPNLGKSQITASIAAVVTTGGTWPVDRGPCKHGDVVFLTAEDDPADTLRPRLEAVEADLHRVHIVDGVIVGYRGDGSREDKSFSLENDLRALASKLTELGNVAVVVIDPISAYLGKTDSHNNAEVRGILAPLSELAARHNAAIIGVSHLTKAAGAQALMRVTGSLAFVAAARAAYLVSADPQDKTRRLFLPLKNNLGPDASGLAFRIEAATVPSQAGPLETSRVAWESEPVTLTADEVMAQSSNPEETSALTDAMDWLRDILADGPLSASDVKSRAEAAGVSWRTVRRAADTLRVQRNKAGMRAGWTWCLPPKVAKTAEDVQQKGLDTFGEVGHLREAENAERELSGQGNLPGLGSPGYPD
jgi:putative DNA primase/helicase